MQLIYGRPAPLIKKNNVYAVNVVEPHVVGEILADLYDAVAIFTGTFVN